MTFAWRFNEGAPAPGIVKRELINDADSLSRRQRYAKVLAEPPHVTRGYSSAPTQTAGARGGEGSNEPCSEGYTSLMSNGDELLRLAEHCRVVVDNVVDAPQALLATGSIGDAALDWQQKICWFQVTIGSGVSC